eukprot:5780558-Pleurochrysis_carterae.AAC.1
MVALVAHEVGAQCGGEVVLGCDEADITYCALVHVEEWRPVAVARELGRLEWADQVRAGQLSTAIRGSAFARWRMDAWCLAAVWACVVISQVVWLGMCKHG